MKIFGINLITKKELKAKNSILEHRVSKLEDIIKSMRETFPFELGSTVYDVQLRNEKGRYAKKNVSLEHSIINDVVIDTKNYFNLVERYKRNDVFLSREDADVYLKEICTNKR